VRSSRNLGWTTRVSFRGSPVDIQISDYVLSSQIHEIRASQRMVADAITAGGCMIVDVRTAPEFSGECFWPSGGQEPGHTVFPTLRSARLDGDRSWPLAGRTHWLLTGHLVFVSQSTWR